jgi:hypothetical protein
MPRYLPADFFESSFQVAESGRDNWPGDDQRTVPIESDS